MATKQNTRSTTPLRARREALVDCYLGIVTHDLRALPGQDENDPAVRVVVRAYCKHIFGVQPGYWEGAIAHYLTSDAPAQLEIESVDEVIAAFLPPVPGYQAAVAAAAEAIATAQL